jgi:hypothetical protein
MMKQHHGKEHITQPNYYTHILLCSGVKELPISMIYGFITLQTINGSKLLFLIMPYAHVVEGFTLHALSITSSLLLLVAIQSTGP